MSTIKDVAKLAGVSASTVSRTLSDRIFVEEETRQKVLKAVAELNYQPSMMAKGLKEGKSYSLGFMVPDINSLFYPMLMKEIEKYTSLEGYTLVLMNNDENRAKEQRALSTMASRGVDGILCMSVEDDNTHLVQFQKDRNIPVVLVNRDSGNSISSILINNEHGGYLMTKHLLEHHHTKIAGMFGDFNRKSFRARCDGCKRAMEEYGVLDYKKYFIYDVKSIDEAYRRTCDMLTRSDRPTAFFAALDIFAIGIYSAVYDCGLKIPEDISVTGFDNIFMTQYMMPPLTTYNAPIEQLAKRCVEVLIQAINNPDSERIHEVISGTLMARKSVVTILE